MELSFAMRECKSRYSDGTYKWAITSHTMLINERAYVVPTADGWMHVTYTDPDAYYEEKGPIHLTYTKSKRPDASIPFEPDCVDERSNSWRVIRVQAQTEVLL